MTFENNPLSMPERRALLKTSAVQAHKVVSAPPQYIVIGNFVTRQDSLTIQVFNEASGLTNECFSFVVKDCVGKQNLPVRKSFGDSIVLKGGEEELRKIKRSLGVNFSYAHVDEASLEGFIRAEEDFQKYGRVIPGSEKPKATVNPAPSFLV